MTHCTRHDMADDTGSGILTIVLSQSRPANARVRRTLRMRNVVRIRTVVREVNY